MSNVQVAVRIRPLIDREVRNNEIQVIAQKNNTVMLRESMNQQHDDPSIYNTYQFTFDKVFGETSTHADVYQTCVRDIVDNFLQGYNGCIFAYGQTSSGKTHTIMNEQFQGVIPQAIEHIFDHVINQQQDYKYLLRASYFQIYNETVMDLLSPTQINLKIREQNQQIYVENLTYFQLQTPQDLHTLVQQGDMNRISAETKMNTNSSRSHSILTIYLDQQTQNSQNHIQLQTSSKLQILDLAGSERSHSTLQNRQSETKHINQSLAILGNVMQQIVLSQKNQQIHIQFRDSKLTRILQDSVGGNCKTLLITCVSPSSNCFFESLNSLKFADRAKAIKQHAVINEIEDYAVQIEKYRLQIIQMKQLIAEAQKKMKLNIDITDEQQIQQLLNDDNYQEYEQQLSNQLNTLQQQINSSDFQQLQNTFDQIKNQDNLKTDNINQIDNINQLRNKSIQQRDFLLLLSQKLQSVEQNVQSMQQDLQTIKMLNNQLEDKVTQQKEHSTIQLNNNVQKILNTIDQIKIVDNKQQIQQQLNQVVKFIQDNQNNELLQKTNTNTENMHFLDYEQKLEELLNLKEDFQSENKQLMKQYQQLQNQIFQEKKQLEERISIQLQNQQFDDQLINIDILECKKERELLINIFENKILLNVQQLQQQGIDQLRLDNLKNYCNKVLEAIDQSELRSKLISLFE